MRRALIVAVGRNGAIGRGGDLPWRLPADLRHFKRLTTGHHLIIGRRTWESVGVVLPGRTMVVVTRDSAYDPGVEGVIVARSLEEGLWVARWDDEPFVAGGSGLYREAFGVVDRMYITRIDAEFDADTFFPEYNDGDWDLTEEESFPADEKNPWPYSFLTFDRRSVSER